MKTTSIWSRKKNKQNIEFPNDCAQKIKFVEQKISNFQSRRNVKAPDLNLQGKRFFSVKSNNAFCTTKLVVLTKLTMHSKLPNS